MLTGTWVDDDAVLARSLHARVRARWIHARTGPTHTCTGPTHACSHQVPTPARSQGPSRTLTPGPHARSVSMHARTGSPCLLARGVPTHARMLALGPHTRLVSMHARTGPCAHARSGSPRPLARGVPMHVCTGPMHARSHRAPMPTRLRGPHVRRIPALMHAASHVVCISSYM